MSEITEDEAIDLLVAFEEETRRNTRYTMEEFQELKKILKQGRLHFIVEPNGNMWGFSLIVYRYPPFPCTPPVQLALIKGHRIPEELQNEEKIVPGRRLDDQFRELSPFSHTEENKSVLQKFRLRQPESLDYYGY